MRDEARTGEGGASGQEALPKIRVVPDVTVTDISQSATARTDPGRDVRGSAADLVSQSGYPYEDSDEEESLFKAFTTSSYERLLIREKEDRERAEERKNNVNEGRLVDGELKFDDGEEGEDEKAEPDPALKEGGPLPSSLDEEFPKKLLRKPIEEIDPAVRDKVCHRSYLTPMNALSPNCANTQTGLRSVSFE
ncbi:hypothetical protein LSH36_267g03088 [Paralvinella palmiformis]|uniref:Uncharacterized protein n=1 Tax=Paralvinella palmiformis TaxID=53620 RepID=A0AAD9JL79_9ANNE|nr:hypothetical protein LSH36_267g03088 [Paralvinella palmiformis]